jgi:uncharacterized peroxidase-related enzyme
MPYFSSMDVPIYTEEEATGEVAQLYDEIKREMQLPFVPNFYTALSSSPSGLAMLWEMSQAANKNTTLPQSLGAMINYTIATKSYCEYCSSAYEMNCRTLGVNEETLEMLIKDLENVNPRRIRIIINFALKAAKYPQELNRDDFDKVRDEGVTDAEIIEIIMISAMTVLTDIVADALKIEVDPAIFEVIGRDQVFVDQ